MDELHEGGFSWRGCVGRTEFRLDWGPARARARDDAEHFDLLGVYRLVLFRAGAMAPGNTEIRGSVRDGRRMVARGCAGDGGVAGKKTAFGGWREWGRSDR